VDLLCGQVGGRVEAQAGLGGGGWPRLALNLIEARPKGGSGNVMPVKF
jgi:hypothetical protein